MATARMMLGRRWLSHEAAITDTPPRSVATTSGGRHCWPSILSSRSGGA
ncbi:hypothetical protein [Ramlibacter sp.]|nr:hypothetical protein [Ramlibacter sp.]